MAELARINVVWSGWSGGPGINRLVFSRGFPAGSWDAEAVDDITDGLHTAYTAFFNNMGVGIKANIDNYVTLFDSASGENTGVVVGTTTRATISGPGAAQSEAFATMFLAQFQTGEWINGRQLRGRAFLGPVAGNSVTDQGLVNDGTRTAIAAAWTALLSGVGARLAVYQRPGPNNAGVGAYADVQRVTCAAKPAILRSRRD